jgi:hypothetical protein
MLYSQFPVRRPKFVAELLGQFPRSLLVVGTNKVAIALFGGSKLGMNLLAAAGRSGMFERSNVPGSAET